MKLTAVFLLAFALHISARGYSQTVTLSFKDAPLSRVFSAIQKETGYTFTYFMEDVSAYRASFTVRGVSIEEALTECLKGLPLAYTVVKENRNVSIREKQITLTEPLQSPEGESSMQNSLHLGIHGHIVDTLGNPLGGGQCPGKGDKDCRCS